MRDDWALTTQEYELNVWDTVSRESFWAQVVWWRWATDEQKRWHWHTHHYKHDHKVETERGECASKEDAMLAAETWITEHTDDAARWLSSFDG